VGGRLPGRGLRLYPAAPARFWRLPSGRWQPLGSVVLAACEASGVAGFRAEQFSIRVDDEVLADLRARIRNTRWPGPAPGARWEQGTDLGYLRGLLGYRRYGAHGGGFGAAVTTFMALDDPAPLLGIHLSGLDLAPCTGPGSRPLSAAEQACLARYQRWREEDRGYGAI
jgi:hypothetical protein